jgi:ribose-phosphate pyrophosphokinase
MIDTAGTLCNAAATAVLDQGASEVYAAATHGILSGPAVERLEGSSLAEVVIADTIAPTEKVAACEKIRIKSVAPLVAEAIKRVHTGESISTLFL